MAGISLVIISLPVFSYFLRTLAVLAGCYLTGLTSSRLVRSFVLPRNDAAGPSPQCATSSLTAVPCPLRPSLNYLTRLTMSEFNKICDLLALT